MNSQALINFFQRAIKPLRDRVYIMIGRAIITAVDDSKMFQELQLSALAGETLGKVQRFQNFGFTSNPPLGTEAIISSLGGNRDNTIVIATDNRNIRIKNLESGETAIYTDDGTYIKLKKTGKVEVKAATLLTIDVPDSLIKGNLTVEGAVVCEETLEVQGISTLQQDVLAGANVVATGLVLASGFGGLSGAPMTATVNIETTGTVKGADVESGGKSVNTLVTTYNSHTHPENGTGGGTTSAPNQTV